MSCGLARAAALPRPRRWLEVRLPQAFGSGWRYGFAEHHTDALVRGSYNGGPAPSGWDCCHRLGNRSFGATSAGRETGCRGATEAEECCGRVKRCRSTNR